MTVTTRELALDDDIRFLPGIGPRRAEAFEKLGVRTAGDLLEYLPARYDRREERTVEHLDEGMTATIVGQVTAVRKVYGRRGGTVSAMLTDNTGRCSLSWFNAPWVVDKLRPGDMIRASGRVSAYRGRPQIVNPRFTVVTGEAAPADESAEARLEAVYPASAEMSSRDIAKLMAASLPRLLPLVHEWYSERYCADRELLSRREALAEIHRPDGTANTDRARRRLAYDEFMLLRLAVLISRRHGKFTAIADPIVTTPLINERIRKRFPFPLTAAQDTAVRAIVADLARNRPMDRLLQGDVGCGKTVVALYAALSTVANRKQAAIMAPTELLAEQHHRSIERYLAGSRVRHCLLTGALSPRERRERITDISAGRMDLVVGTQALIQEDVQFNRLGLAIVDEQHRFGVRQRAIMRGKGPAPHYLVMTATPIPRTLAMTVFGDLDVTTIDGLPPGRAGITTRLVRPADVPAAWAFVRKRLAAREQAFVVYPIVDDSDKLALRSATSEFERLRRDVFPESVVGLLHGRMATRDRESVMADFAAGRVQALVATTVIEVGIDVPAATMMVVEHAERYGLSQLHQLRGRVGRGGKRGYCFLMTDSDNPAVLQRLTALVESNDGFRIAEEDLRLRGPGEMFGTRQHGLPELRVADLINDGDLLRAAQRDADELLRADPRLAGPEHAALRAAIQSRYSERAELLGVG